MIWRRKGEAGCGRGDELQVDPVLLAAACQERSARIIRDKILGAREIFGEVGWDLLLEIYVSQGQHRPATLVSLCNATHLTLPLAKRWIAVLEEAGFVYMDLRDHSHDAVILMTSLGRQRLEVYLDEL